MNRLGAVFVVSALFLAAVSWVLRPRVPANRGAAILSGAQTPPAVLAHIDRSCRDCHSNETRYPWYSYVAPISLLIQRDVLVGREHLNLSKWSEYTAVRRQRLLSEIANQVQDGGMPLSIYTWLHPEAKLTDADAAAIFEWTQAERARLIAASVPK